MKLRTIWILLFLAGLAVGAEVVGTPGPEPAPWWMRVEEFQGLALRWLTAISIVGGALITLIVKLQSNFKELRARQDRLGAEKQELQRQLTCIAALCPPASGTNPVPPAPPAGQPPSIITGIDGG